MPKPRFPPTLFAVHSPRRSGITLIELMVVLAVIGLLISILVPAIQSVREVSRRLECANNLKQIALASHNYSSVYNILPLGCDLGPLASIIPYVTGGNYLSTPGFYRCPSDSGQVSVAVNYALSIGVLDGQSFSGCFGCADKPIRWIDITDGQSNTAMFSEWLRGPSIVSNPPSPVIDRSQPHRLVFGVVMPPGSTLDVPAAMRVCDETSPSTAPVYSESRGTGWGGSDILNTTYAHNLPPNRNSCYLAPVISGWPVNSSSSYHSRGVNCALADGSVRFVSEVISPSIWQAMGTRSGGE